MGADVKLVVLFGILHLVGLGLITMLLVMFVRSDTVRPWAPPPEDDGGGGGGGSPPGRRRPEPGGGGLPLPDAMPARMRLREPVRLAELRPARRRRPEDQPAHAPSPARLPAGPPRRPR